MTCCGKGKAIFHKGKNIAKGYTALVTGKEYEFADARIAVCRDCEYSTWMTELDYAAWLLKNGVKVLTHLDDLTQLPMLPKQNTGRTIWCRLCKCNIPAKAAVTDEQCPKNKWPETIKQTTNGRTNINENSD